MTTLPWHQELVGRLDIHVIRSEALAGNPLGDPAERPLWVYVPPGYDDEPDRQPFPEPADALFARGEAPPCIVVYVDAWTTYGGSQFVDSPGTGRYHTYLCEDVVGFVDSRYRTLPEARHRGIQGKSSGGFGAMITPMLRPDLFGGLATHAGDALYEVCYIPGFAKSARALREYEGSIERWWEDFRSRPAFTKPGDEGLLVNLGVAACFSVPGLSRLSSPPSRPMIDRPQGDREPSAGETQLTGADEPGVAVGG